MMKKASDNRQKERVERKTENKPLLVFRPMQSLYERGCLKRCVGRHLPAL